MAATLFAESVEYLRAPWSASVPLDTQPVQVAFLPTGTKLDGTETWLDAEWDGVVGNTRSWRILIGPGTTAALASGVYDVYSKVTDITEHPIRQHDTVTIV